MNDLHMTGDQGLRAAVTGLIGLAATAEQELLAEPQSSAGGSAEHWAAAPVVAHNTKFRWQQVQRLRAIRSRRTPPEFAEVDHASAALYAELSAQPADAVARDSWRLAGELAEELRLLSREDLLDPTRNPWLRGRQLWLQVVVRGFWHPMGHLGEYYLGHGQPYRAMTLAEHGVATAEYVGAPAAARGMASYNLACARARGGQFDEAAAALADAITLNPDVRANALRDNDLAGIRKTEQVAALLGG
jgi:tetratricopeptide (TPR) repeat protein